MRLLTSPDYRAYAQCTTIEEAATKVANDMGKARPEYINRWINDMGHEKAVIRFGEFAALIDCHHALFGRAFYFPARIVRD